MSAAAEPKPSEARTERRTTIDQRTTLHGTAAQP